MRSSQSSIQQNGFCPDLRAPKTKVNEWVPEVWLENIC